MFHGLTYESIYSAVRLTVKFTAPDGEELERSGTAFGIKVNDKTVLATNRHLVDLNFGREDSKFIEFKLHSLICATRIRLQDGSPGDVRRLIVPMSHNEILFDENPKNDVAVVYDVQSGNLDGSDIRVWDYCFEYSDIATADEINQQLLPFDFLAFPGFPFGYDKLGLRAIIRSGTVACDPRFDYSFDSKDSGEIVLYEGFSYGGSSGSPVIALPKAPPVNVGAHPSNVFRRLLIVGVNAGHLWDVEQSEAGAHPGLSCFVRSSVIRRIIDKQLRTVGGHKK